MSARSTNLLLLKNNRIDTNISFWLALTCFFFVVKKAASFKENDLIIVFKLCDSYVMQVTVSIKELLLFSSYKRA